MVRIITIESSYGVDLENLMYDPRSVLLDTGAVLYQLN